MRKQVFGRQLKRDTNERKALFKGLMSSLVLSERIKTTEEKAKSIKGQVEKLVTKAKKGGLNAERLIQPYLTTDAIQKMMQDIAPRFAGRNGGYTRIIRLERRFSDNASVVLIEWVEKSQGKKITATTLKPKRKEGTVLNAEAVTAKSTKSEKKTSKAKPAAKKVVKKGEKKK